MRVYQKPIKVNLKADLGGLSAGKDLAAGVDLTSGFRAMGDCRVERLSHFGDDHWRRFLEKRIGHPIRGNCLARPGSNL